MSYGTVQVGRLVLRETFDLKTDVHASHGVRSITITGQESKPPLTAQEVQQRHEDIMTMRDSVVPITWTNKSDHDGFYIVEDISATQINYTGEIVKFDWQIRATRIGPDNSADIESRLTGLQRKNDFNQSGERWHAPAIGHYAYYTGTSLPSGSLSRTAEDGAITVYRGVPSGANPRWAVAATNYKLGRAKVLIDGVERTGTNMRLTSLNWTLKNGLVNVTPGASGGLTIGVWDGSTYDTKAWNLSVGASATPALTQFDAATVIRNDFEMVTLKLMKTRSPYGRTSLDLTLRRGARFVEGYLTTDFSTTLAVWMNVAENSTSPASSGYVTATSDDANGHRAIVGTTKTFQTHSSNVRLHRDAVTALDFYAGAVAGSSHLNLNPYFETNADNWFPEGSTIVRSTAQFHEGSASGLLTPDGVSATARVVSDAALSAPGLSYYLSVWARCAVSRNITIGFDFHDSGLGFISSASTSIAVTANTWKLLEFTATSPANTGFVKMWVSETGTPPSSDTLHIDESMYRLATSSGDQAADLQAQYISAMAEFTMAVKR